MMWFNGYQQTMTLSISCCSWFKCAGKIDLVLVVMKVYHIRQWDCKHFYEDSVLLTFVELKCINSLLTRNEDTQSKFKRWESKTIFREILSNIWLTAFKVNWRVWGNWKLLSSCCRCLFVSHELRIACKCCGSKCDYNKGGKWPLRHLPSNFQHYALENVVTGANHKPGSQNFTQPTLEHEYLWSILVFLSMLSYLHLIYILPLKWRQHDRGTCLQITSVWHERLELNDVDHNWRHSDISIRHKNLSCLVSFNSPEHFKLSWSKKWSDSH